MPRQNVPIFKSNGMSMQKKLTEIKKLEYVAWGAYKYKFQKLMDQLSTRGTSGGIEYWGKLDKIGNAACVGNEDKPWADMLEQMGFDTEGKAELCSTYNDSDVDNIEAYFAPKISYDLNTLDGIFVALDDDLDGLSKVRLTYTIQSFDTTLFPTEDLRPKMLLKANSIANPDPLLPNDEYLGLYTDIARSTFTYYDEGSDETQGHYTEVAPGHNQLTIDKLMTTVVIEGIDSSDAVVTYDEYLLDTTKTLALMHAGEGLQTRTLKSYVERDETVNGDPTIYHDVVEEYGASFVSTYAYDKIDDFHQEGEKHTTTTETVAPSTGATEKQGFSFENYDGKYNNPIWGYGDQKISGELDPDSEFLFYQPDVTDDFGNTRKSSKAYLTVDGLKTAKMSQFFFYLSSYLQFRVIPKKKKWYEKIISAIIGFITSIFSAVLEVFNKIPILQLVVQALASIVASLFGLDASKGLDALANILTTLMVTFLTGGLGTVAGVFSGAVAFTASVAISFGLQLYGAISQMASVGDAMKAQQDAESTNEGTGIEEQKEQWEEADAEEFESDNDATFNDEYDTFAQYNLPMPFDATGEFNKAISFDNLDKKGFINDSTKQKV